MIKKYAAAISLIILTATLTGAQYCRPAAAGGGRICTVPAVKADTLQPGNKTDYMMAGEVDHIPVILYHSIKYEKDNPARLPGKSFDMQMKWLKDNGYITLGLNEFFDCITGEKAITEKSVLITFDDGYRDNYTKAYKILKKYGFKAVIFVITSHIGKGECLTEQQLREMSANGIDIQSHTVSHRKLDTLSYGKQYEELKESKECLEKLTGRSVAFLAYPYGRYNRNTLLLARKLGYKLAFTVEGKSAAAGCDPYKVSRINISGSDDLDRFIKKLEIAVWEPRLGLGQCLKQGTERFLHICI